MTEQTMVAVYDTPAHAELAVQDLLAAGLPETAIHRHAQEGSYAGTSSHPVSRPAEGGFWSSLFGGEPDHDTAVYDRSVQGGSSAVSVKVADEHVTKVMDILEQHSPIDLDERAGSYGMTQAATAGAPLGAPPGAPLGAPMPRPTMTGTTAAESGTIQLSEETLAVGKRVINQGTTRIRRFVVETPVEEQIALHDEHVTIERHPVTDGRAVSAADFTDKTIEMTASAEEAVISKTAHVKEEISLRKEAIDRTETVRDTVRHEDVEITKVPGEGPAAPSVDTTTRKPLI